MDYRAKPNVQSVVLGDVDRLENGNSMFCFSTAGQIDVIDPDKKLLWRMTAPMGYALGYFQQVDSLYPEE